MTPKLVNVKEMIGTPNAILGSQGEKLYAALKPLLEQGQPVRLDFEGLRVLNSGFCNASVGRLYREMGAEAVQPRLECVNLATDRMKTALNDAIQLGQNPELLQSMQQAFEEYFQRDEEDKD